MVGLSCRFQVVVICSFFLYKLDQVTAFGRVSAAAAVADVVLKDYAKEVSGLFGNMRLPASILGGSILGLGVSSAPKVEESDSRFMKLFKRMNLLLGIASFLNEIVAITYSSIAINKLSEVTAHELSDSLTNYVAANCKLAWLGTNVHFLFGLFGFGLLVGSKAFFLYGRKIGNIAACWSIAATLQCLSVVNQGIAEGGGSGRIGDSFGSNIVSLTIEYARLLFSNAWNNRATLSIMAIALMTYSFWLVVKFIMDSKTNDVGTQKVE